MPVELTRGREYRRVLSSDRVAVNMGCFELNSVDNGAENLYAAPMNANDIFDIRLLFKDAHDLTVTPRGGRRSGRRSSRGPDTGNAGRVSAIEGLRVTRPVALITVATARAHSRYTTSSPAASGLQLADHDCEAYESRPVGQSLQQRTIT